MLSQESLLARPSSRYWLLLPLLLMIPAIELIGHTVIQARVPTEAEWAAASAYVRAHHEPEDVIVAAPAWADPLLRKHLGDLLPLPVAGRSDLAPFKRYWELGIRGATSAEAPRIVPEEDLNIGPFRIRRWDLGEPTVRYDFASHVREASVSITRGGRPMPCPIRRMPESAGGINTGSMFPSERAQCDMQRTWLFVADTVHEDLDYLPRHCIWQHPQGSEPVSATFKNVPLGDRLVFYGGLYAQHERKLEGGPVKARVYVDDELVGSIEHRDGEGWKRAEFEMGGKATGTVRVDVTAEQPHLRTFCWSATTREGVPRPADIGDWEAAR